MRKGHKPSHFRKFYRVNNQITAANFRLLEETGKQIGIVSRQEALTRAQTDGLDLVEIAPNATPVVVKLIDYSKFLYQEKKKKQEEKKGSRASETKQIWSGPFIGDHDLEIKLKKAREFIEEGNKVKFMVKFSGRAITKKDLGEGVLKRVIDNLQDVAKIDREIHMEGRAMVVMLSKGKQ